ncbi:MAG: MBL fold metallo-hydrolase [Rhizomicrobium sp.]
MNTWLRRALIALAVLLAVGGGAYYWLIVESGTPSGTYALDLKEVRRLADSMPGPRVASVHAEHVAAFSFPRTAVLAGDGWKPLPMAIFSYRLMFSDSSSAVIDTGVTARGAAEMNAALDDAAAQNVRAGIKNASLIVLTHEHPDHIGGLLDFPFLRAEMKSGHVKLNAEQLANLERFNPGYHKEAFAGYHPIAYDKYLAIAPGVVLIRSPGHTPGSQMVYVKTAKGDEFLFTGDVAWTMRNIDEVRERARLVTWFFLGEDRDAVLAQLAALNALKKAEPHLHIVPGHDLGVATALENEGLLVKGFTATR